MGLAARFRFARHARRPPDEGSIASRAWKVVASRKVGGATSVADGCSRRYLWNVAQPLPIPPPGFDELTPDEKLQYVAALWDRIVAEQSELPISEAQRAVLRDRLAAHRANPEAARPWSEARRDIEHLLRQRPSR